MRFPSHGLHQTMMTAKLRAMKQDAEKEEPHDEKVRRPKMKPL
jgi:hypothetical protein